MPLLRRAEKRNCRVVVLGLSRVGKTANIHRYLYSKFPEKHKETIEDTHHHYVTCKGLSVEIDILDTSGSYEFPAMRNLAITTGDAFLLVYSLDVHGSFENARRLIEEINALKHDQDYFVLVIANKTGVCGGQKFEHAIKEATVSLEWKLGYFKTSAKTGETLDIVFETLEQKVMGRLSVESKKLSKQKRLSLPTLKTIKHKADKQWMKLKSRSYSTE